MKINKLKWLINDLGLNEADAWLSIIGGAALVATILMLLKVFLIL